MCFYNFEVPVKQIWDPQRVSPLDFKGTYYVSILFVVKIKLIRQQAKLSSTCEPASFP